MEDAYLPQWDDFFCEFQQELGERKMITHPPDQARGNSLHLLGLCGLLSTWVSLVTRASLWTRSTSLDQWGGIDLGMGLASSPGLDYDPNNLLDLLYRAL